MKFEKFISNWNDNKWPGRTDTEIAAKIAEECGEVVGAVIKIGEDRSTEQDLQNELGDLMIAASVLAGRFGWSLEDLREQRFKEVIER